MPGCWWRVVAVMLAAGSGLTPEVAQAADTEPIIAVKVYDPDGSVTTSLLRAQSITRDIYEHAGVRLEWIVDDVTVAESMLTVVITDSGTAPAGLTTDVMGVVPSPGNGTRGTTAYVFSDRVIEFAESHHLVPAVVLGCAFAHEIGHLLLPVNAHRSDGIMRARWHPALFPPRAPGVLGFPPEQARLLRLRARYWQNGGVSTSRSGR